MDITILTHAGSWKGLSPTVKRAAEAAVLALKLKRVQVTIVLTDDAEVRGLNANYRKKDRPTNVLSFPNGEKDDGVTLLGDVVLAYETIVAEAAAQNKTPKAHVTHLVVHGVLHLVGFDHMNEADAKRMESKEILILKRMGIANPYEAS